MCDARLLEIQLVKVYVTAQDSYKSPCQTLFRLRSWSKGMLFESFKVNNDYKECHNYTLFSRVKSHGSSYIDIVLEA